MDDDMWLVSLTGSRVRPLMNAVGMVADGGQPVLFKEESARGSFLASRIQYENQASQYERQFTFSLTQLIFGNGRSLDILSSTTLKHGRLKITILLFGFRGSQQLPVVLNITATGFFPSAFI